MENEIKYDLNKVNKFNAVLITMIALFSIVNYYLTKQEHLLLVSSVMIFASVFAFVMYKTKINNKIKMYVIPIIPAITCTYYGIVAGGYNSYILTLICCVLIAGLYLNPKVVIVDTVIIDILIILLYWVFSIEFLGEGISSQDLIEHVTKLNVSSIILVFLTKWASEYVDLAIKKQKESSETLEKLKETFIHIDQSTNELHESVEQATNNMDMTKESSETVTSAVEEISRGIEEQARNISNITELVNFAGQSVIKTSELSKNT
ncbi:MAG: hypothetical protein ACERKV_03490, partial [Clostridiaceae bacterium]